MFRNFRIEIVIRSVLAIAAYYATIGKAEDNLVVFTPITINGVEARFAIDTGSDSSALFKVAARRFGITLESGSNSTQCSIGIGTKIFKNQQVIIMESPPVGASFDGILGWDQLEKLIFEFDWDNRHVTFHDKLPPSVADWRFVKIRTNATPLILENEKDGGDGIVLIDSGSESGVGLSAELWKQWQSKHVDSPTTLSAVWNFHDGPVVLRQSWANEIKVGPLKVERVLIEEATPLYTSLPKFDAIVGTAALCQYKVVVDGPARTLYLSTHQGCEVKPSYNRIGAVFIPDDSGANIAHVVTGSPAHRAGIRDGDTLRSVNGVEVRKADGKIVSLRSYFNGAAGEEVSILISREKRDVLVKVKLVNIFLDDELKKD